MRILRSLLILGGVIAAEALTLAGSAWISVEIPGFDDGSTAGLVVFAVLFAVLGAALFYPVLKWRNFLKGLSE